MAEPHDTPHEASPKLTMLHLVSFVERYPESQPTAEYIGRMHQKLTRVTNTSVRPGDPAYIAGKGGVYREAADGHVANLGAPSPDGIRSEMALLQDQIAAPTWKDEGFSPVHKAAFAFARMESCLPFADGNGRTAWLVASSMLIGSAQTRQVPSVPPPDKVREAVAIAIANDDLGPLTGLMKRAINPRDKTPDESVPSPFRVRALDRKDTLEKSRVEVKSMPAPMGDHDQTQDRTVRVPGLQRPVPAL